MPWLAGVGHRRAVGSCPSCRAQGRRGWQVARWEVLGTPAVRFGACGLSRTFRLGLRASRGKRRVPDCSSERSRGIRTAEVCFMRRLPAVGVGLGCRDRPLGFGIGTKDLAGPPISGAAPDGSCSTQGTAPPCILRTPGRWYCRPDCRSPAGGCRCAGGPNGPGAGHRPARASRTA